MNDSNTDEHDLNQEGVDEINEEKDVRAMDVKIFHRVNRLKIKAGGSLSGGPGRLDLDKIEKADSVVQKMSEVYPVELQKALDDLDEKWKEVLAHPEDARKENVEIISTLANQIKDLAGLFEYEIMEYFAGSFRDFIFDTELTRKEHVIIGQAHVDVMWVVYRENLKDNAGPVAEELKKVVAEAIQKYS